MKRYDMLKVLQASFEPRPVGEKVYEVIGIDEREWFDTFEEVKKNVDPRELIDRYDSRLLIWVNLASESYSEAIALLLLKNGKRYATVRDIVEAFLCIYLSRQRTKELVKQFNAWLKKEIEDLTFPYG